MKYQYLLVLITLISLMGCQSEEEKMQAQITELEKHLEDDPTTEKAQEVLKAYEGYIAQFPEDTKVTPRYLYRAAALEYRMNRFSGATDFLKRAIKEYYSSSNTPKAVIFLGDIYQDKLGNEDNAITVYQALIQAFPGSEEVNAAHKKLPNKLVDLESRIKKMGSQMFDDSTGRIEYRLANNFITSSELYALILPDSPKAPEMLYKGAEIARTIRSYDKALKMYAQVVEEYPESERAPQALFMQAFTLDSDLRQLDKAKALYEKFIADYPEDDFVDDAQILLENLGKDDEEIIRSFTEKNAEAEEEVQ
ncbi:MAG: tetratricopeptide repeat protein [Lewinellaceae bacterium]|nr:tetratricopeptide repeat protein [Lewinellaceae bacterium]